MAAMTVVEDDPQAPAVKCWGCGEEGHTKRECPNKPPPSQPPVPRGKPAAGRGGRGGKGSGKPTPPPVLPRPSVEGTGVSIRCAYPPCGKPGHTEAQCWMKYPHLRPLSFTTQGNGGEVPLLGGRTMEARMAELQDTLAQLVATSAQPTPGASSSRASTSGTRGHFPHDPFKYGAAGQVVGATVTRSQIGGLPPPLPIVPLTNVDERRSCHKGPVDAIGQARLPMTFNMADVMTPTPGKVLLESKVSTVVEEDVLKGLALKVLQVPLFSGAQLQYTEFDPAAVYYMAGKIMAGKATMPACASTKAMREEGDLPPLMAVDDSDVRAQAAMDAKEALRHWTGWKKKVLPMQAPFKQEQSLGLPSCCDTATVYLADLSARSARERQQVKPGVVLLVNEGHVLLVSQSKAPSVYPQRVLMDTGAQSVMLGKRLAAELGLVASNLDSCPFMVATSLGGTEQPRGITKEPLHLRFQVGSDAYAYIVIRCVVTNAETYDNLVGQHALYPIGFALDNWTEEAWF